MNYGEYKDLLEKKAYLTAEEEREAFLFYQNNPTVENRNLFALHFMPFVNGMLNKFEGCNIPYEDLSQEGFIALCEAMKRYNINNGTKFSSYSTICVFHSLQEYIRNNSGIIRVPKHIYKVAAKVSVVEQEYENTYGVEPSDDFIIQEVKISRQQLSDVKKIKSNFVVCMPAEQFVNDNEDEEHSIKQKKEYQTSNIEKNYIDDEIRKSIRNAIKDLSNEERDAINTLYGIDCECMQLKDYAEKNNITRRRVKFIRAQAIKKLRKKTELFSA